MVTGWRGLVQGQEGQKTPRFTPSRRRNDAAVAFHNGCSENANDHTYRPTSLSGFNPNKPMVFPRFSGHVLCGV